MKSIKFSHNWNNKLSLGVFTTIRNYNPEKYDYYKRSINDQFEILLKDVKIGECILQEVMLSPFSEVDTPLLYVDTGIIGFEENLKLFKNFGLKDDNDSVIVLVFMKIKYESPNN